jgi:hypothetical protein
MARITEVKTKDGIELFFEEGVRYKVYYLLGKDRVMKSVTGAFKDNFFLDNFIEFQRDKPVTQKTNYTLLFNGKSENVAKKLTLTICLSKKSIILAKKIK